MDGLNDRNRERHCDAALRQVAHAQAALPKLLTAPTNGFYTQPVLWRYQEALRLRKEFPDATLAELAAKAGWSKPRYWRILVRAFKLADKL